MLEHSICPRIKISEYEYGRVTKRLRKAVDWINQNRSKIRKDIINKKIAIEFDFDDYWGMPKSICKQLSSDEVDFIQSQVEEFWMAMYDAIYGKGEEQDESKERNKMKVIDRFSANDEGLIVCKDGKDIVICAESCCRDNDDELNSDDIKIGDKIEPSEWYLIIPIKDWKRISKKI